jgi:cytochrome c oxidase subunit 2
MVYFLIKYNEKKNITPVNIEGNLFLETIWTVVPGILFLVMFYYGWVGYKVMREVPEDARIVKVSARMWSWLFEYENGKQSNALVLPIGKPVKLVMTSQDVIHSFYVPAFRVKQDTVPGMETYQWFTPTELGSYDAFCAEYCGLRHSYMLSKVEILPEEKFMEWYGREVPKEEIAKREPRGLQLMKDNGCDACHTLDGSPLLGPTFKGIWGKKEQVLTTGKEREIVVDEEYIRKSMLEPMADQLAGFPPIMPSFKDILTEDEIAEIIAYLKELK